MHVTQYIIYLVIITPPPLVVCVVQRLWGCCSVGRRGPVTVQHQPLLRPPQSPCGHPAGTTSSKHQAAARTEVMMIKQNLQASNQQNILGLKLEDILESIF